MFLEKNKWIICYIEDNLVYCVIYLLSYNKIEDFPCNKIKILSSCKVLASTLLRNANKSGAVFYEVVFQLNPFNYNFIKITKKDNVQAEIL